MANRQSGAWFLGSGSTSYSHDFTIYLGPGSANVASYLTTENLGTGKECVWADRNEGACGLGSGAGD